MTKKWNESGFRPPLCTYRLNWARRTSWGWWDDWDDTVLQTQDSKFEPWRSEAEHATSRSRRLPTILTFTRGWGRNNFVSFKPPRPGTEPRTLAWKAAVLTTTLGPPPKWDDTALQTQNSQFEPWWSEAENATFRSRRLPTILNLYEWAGKKHLVYLKLECQSRVRTRNLRFSKQSASTTAPGSPPRRPKLVKMKYITRYSQ